jgi:hypothetical protein
MFVEAHPVGTCRFFPRHQQVAVFQTFEGVAFSEALKPRVDDPGDDVDAFVPQRGEREVRAVITVADDEAARRDRFD